ncbi:MAG: PEP-CTERM sorting domain-containing protein [Crocosphaera sp.]|nr:PEP-CTERM sorting domain-containing protein [Crocosphaera sp.]
MIQVQHISRVLIPLISTIVIGKILKAQPTFAITFEETNQGSLSFYNQGESIGNGSFEYTSNPITGTFLTFPDDAIFTQDPNQFNDNFPIDSFSISLEDNFHLITNIQAQILGSELSPIFDNQLISGNSFNTALLFNPLDSEFFIPNSDQIFSIGIGDAFSGTLSTFDGWLLTDSNSGNAADFQVLLSDDGRFFGFIVESPEFGVGGTWTAQAVPEPLTTLGVGTAIAFGAGFKRHLGKSKKK